MRKRGRREGKVKTCQRNLDIELGQRFHLFRVSLASDSPVLHWHKGECRVEHRQTDSAGTEDAPAAHHQHHSIWHLYSRCIPKYKKYRLLFLRGIFDNKKIGKPFSRAGSARVVLSPVVFIQSSFLLVHSHMGFFNYRLP